MRHFSLSFHQKIKNTRIDLTMNTVFINQIRNILYEIIISIC